MRRIIDFTSSDVVPHEIFAYRLILQNLVNLVHIKPDSLPLTLRGHTDHGPPPNHARPDIAGEWERGGE